MSRAIKYIARCQLPVVLFIFSWVAIGCLESSFRLSGDSKLPNWVAVPSGLNRADVSVTLNYYGTYGNNAKFIIKDLAGKTLASVDGKIICHTEPSNYPSYELVAANGTSEVIEHRQAGPVFYFNDDPAVKQKLLSCKQ
jgi:hypothetical protein